jgi:hypothetical protein
VYGTGSGTFVGDIPPRNKAFFNTAECVVKLNPSCEKINAFASIPHAHFLGTAVWTEHYRSDKFGQLTYVRFSCFLMLFIVPIRCIVSTGSHWELLQQSSQMM